MHNDPGSLPPGAAAGITEPMIRELVHAFYGRVRTDTLLGPIFTNAIKDWDAHLALLCTFWSSVALASRRYKGTPMRAHADLPALTGAHFDRWLLLFRATAAELCPRPAAAFFIDRAERIAQSLELGIAIHRGQSLAPGVRLT